MFRFLAVVDHSDMVEDRNRQSSSKLGKLVQQLHSQYSKGNKGVREIGPRTARIEQKKLRRVGKSDYGLGKGGGRNGMRARAFEKDFELKNCELPRLLLVLFNYFSPRL